MAKKQTRRSISVSRKKYEQLAAYSKRTGHSMSQLAEVGIGLVIDCDARPSMPTPTVESI